MDVSPESNARFKAFRQLVFRCSEQLSSNELHALVYVWLYSEKESYKDASGVSIFSRLEATGKFSPWNPEGLLEMLKELKRNDLCSEVKDFMKIKWPKVVKKGTKNLVCTTDEDLQATFEVVVAQATVLMQHIEAFEIVLLQEKDARERARKVITEAAQTAKTLSERLLRAQSELYEANNTDHDQYVDLDNYRSQRARASSLTTSISQQCLPTPTSLTPTHTTFTRIAPTQTTPIDADIGEYVDMSSLKLGKNKKKNGVLPTTANSTGLASYHSDPATSKKCPTTVGLSTAVATASPSSESPSHTATCNEYSVPTSSAGSSRHGSIDANMYLSPLMLGPLMQEEGALYCNLEEIHAAVMTAPLSSEASTHSAIPCNEYSVPTSRGSSRQGSIDADMYLSPSTQGDALYCNLEEMQAKVLKKLSKQSFDSTVNTPDSAPAMPPDELYTSMSSSTLPHDIGLPPRDIQRSKLHTSMSLPIVTEKSPPERISSLSSVEEGPPSSSNDSGDALSQKDSDHASGVVGNRPSIAPKPRIKPKPDMQPRRSSVSHMTHMRVRSRLVSKSVRCTSVLGCVKNSVLANQKTAVMSRDSEGERQLSGESSYYTHLHAPEQKDDSDRMYAVVRHH